MLQNSVKFHQLLIKFFKWCGGQIHKQVCQISSGFCVPEIIKISSFLFPLFKKGITF